MPRIMKRGDINGVFLTLTEAENIYKMASNGREYISDQEWLYATAKEKQTARNVYDWMEGVFGKCPNL